MVHDSRTCMGAHSPEWDSERASRRVHVVVVCGDDEGAERLGDHGEVGVHNIGDASLCQSPADSDRLVGSMHFEMSQRPAQIGLPGGIAPYLRQHGMSGVQRLASFGCSLDQGPEPGVRALAVGDERSGVDDQRSTP